MKTRIKPPALPPTPSTTAWCLVTFASRLSPPARTGGETHPRGAEHRNNTTRLLLPTPLQTDNIPLRNRRPHHWAYLSREPARVRGEGGVCFCLPIAMQPDFDCLNDCGNHHPVVEVRWRGRARGVSFLHPSLPFFFLFCLPLFLSFRFHVTELRLTSSYLI
jgi:hypothetical protein